MTGFFSGGSTIVRVPSAKDYERPPRERIIERPEGKSVLKFTTAAVADWFEAGSIRLSSVQYYRGREDKWIGDDFENRTIHPVDDYTFTGDGRDLDRIGPGVRSSAGARVSGVNFAYEAIDCFVLCFSVGSFDLMADVMLQKEPDNYNACLQVLKPERLARAIYHTGETSDSISLRDLVHPPQIGMVKYIEMVRYGNTPYEPPSPFRKRPEYKAQNELRAVYYFRRPGLPERLDVKFRVPPKSIQRIA